jgi:hypothetical protein
MLREIIGEEQFGFLHNIQIHDAIVIAQEVLHSVKKQNLKATILKVMPPPYAKGYFSPKVFIYTSTHKLIQN